MKEKSPGTKKFRLPHYPKIRTHIISAILVLILCSGAASAKSVNLARMRMNWATALPGKIIGQPLKNGSSYVAVHDGGGIIAFTEDGKILWQQNFDEPLSPFLSIGASGMIYAISKSNKIFLLRSDGSTVWSADAGFEIIGAAMPGRDGRVYIRGKENVACYGNKGTRRWKEEIRGQDTSIGLTELNEGTLLIFEQRSDGTVARTITPFGEKTSAFLMNGKVIDARTVQEGSLISFSDGKVILATETDGKLYFDWTIKAGPSPLIVTHGHTPGTASILSGNSSMLIQTETGKVLATYPSVSSSGIISSGKTRQGLFFANQTSALCYSDSGEEEWSVTLNPKKKISTLFATDSGYLVLCTNSWTVEAYRIKQIPTPQDYSPPPSFKSGTYSAMYAKTGAVSTNLHGRAISEDSVLSMKKSFFEGDFGKSEKDWMAVLDAEMTTIDKHWSLTISQTQTETLFFQKNLDYAKEIINLASSTENTAFHEAITVMLRKNTDTRKLEWLVQAAGNMAMDEDFLMLAEMVKIAQKYNKNDTLLLLICDSTYEICSYMGRDAFISQGNEVLSTMLGSKYSQQVRSYARATMEKLLVGDRK